MTKHVGVARSAKGLRLALAALKALDAGAATDSVLSNMILTARLIAAAALMRKESRGGHYRVDYPTANPALQRRTFMTLDDLEALDQPPRSASGARRSPDAAHDGDADSNAAACTARLNISSMPRFAPRSTKIWE